MPEEMTLAELIKQLNESKGEFFVRVLLLEEGGGCSGEGIERCVNPVGGGLTSYERYSNTLTD